jgi:Recombination endonuclease VII
MKACRDCGESKALTEFPPAKRRSDGRASYCRTCMNVRSNQSIYKRRAAAGRAVTPRRVVPDSKKWCPQCETIKEMDDFPRNRSARGGRGGYCKPCHNARGVDTYTRLYGSTREYHLRRRYGIGQVDVDRMLAEQGGLCACCDKPNPEHVDHDHETGNVRGMLCFNCNQALGNARDDIETLQRLRNYLIVRRPHVTRRLHSEHPPSADVLIELADGYAHSGATR